MQPKFTTAPVEKPSGTGGVGYVRVSDEIQDTARQHTSIKTWSSRVKFDVIKMFEDQGGRRHKSYARQNFKSLMKEVERHEVDWVVVDKQERLGYIDEFEWYHFIYLFRKHRVEHWEARSGKCLSRGDVATIITTGVDATSSMAEVT